MFNKKRKLRKKQELFEKGYKIGLSGRPPNPGGPGVPVALEEKMGYNLGRERRPFYLEAMKLEEYENSN